VIDTCYFLFLAWVKALAATLLTVFFEPGLLSILDAFDATVLDVYSCFSLTYDLYLTYGNSLAN
jgi:hypothetical protein